jgi:hypothetical protein
MTVGRGSVRAAGRDDEFEDDYDLVAATEV